MTVVFIGGTNGLLSQVTVRIILALVLSNQRRYRMRRSIREGYGQDLQRRSGWKGFYDDLPESTQGP
jgi:hypothetical protein